MDAFDSDVLIYAIVAGHPLGRRVRALFPTAGAAHASVGIGSVLLVPEVLTKPLRDNATTDFSELSALLRWLDLLPADGATADRAASLGAKYGLRAADALHLATAVGAGADRFLTDNRSDFRPSITEIEVVYPDQLPDPRM